MILIRIKLIKNITVILIKKKKDGWREEGVIDKFWILIDVTTNYKCLPKFDGATFGISYLF